MSDKHNLSEIRRAIKEVQTFCRDRAEEYLARTGVSTETFIRTAHEHLIRTSQSSIFDVDISDTFCFISAVTAIYEGHVFLVPVDEVLSAVTNFGNYTKIASEEQALFNGNKSRFYVNLPYPRSLFVLYRCDEQRAPKVIAFCSANQLTTPEGGDIETMLIWISLNEYEPFSEVSKIKDTDTRARVFNFFMRTIIAMIDKGGLNKTIDSLSKLKKERAKKAQKEGKDVPYSGDITYLTSRSEGGGGSGTRNGGTVAAHWVRGHLKRCKTGIYWWNAHIAGSGEVKKRTAYKL